MRSWTRNLCPKPAAVKDIQEPSVKLAVASPRPPASEQPLRQRHREVIPAPATTGTTRAVRSHPVASTPTSVTRYRVDRSIACPYPRRPPWPLISKDRLDTQSWRDCPLLIAAGSAWLEPLTSCMPCHPRQFARPYMASLGNASALLKERARQGAVVRRKATWWIAADNLLTGETALSCSS
jgi:hypothetical protein